ncbi:hypothetical protein PRIPAC_86157 [Pristionchus pacificus]|uniref:Uncharacterized protein n=1 Tax=Pristionchus pacificus TaxID=54126 RepID=A0A2A6CCD2_PRIPA|nr:hypothetical protein PRIPAC_86157 [Pristionchus pacificus]|eukprot:PDM75748.1 hypothetical protein PRIPAC_40127 [Pristionchus pacificus]
MTFTLFGIKAKDAYLGACHVEIDSVLLILTHFNLRFASPRSIVIGSASQTRVNQPCESSLIEYFRFHFSRSELLCCVVDFPSKNSLGIGFEVGLACREMALIVLHIKSLPGSAREYAK